VAVLVLFADEKAHRTPAPLTHIVVAISTAYALLFLV